jgi:hypothetical protein
MQTTTPKRELFLLLRAVLGTVEEGFRQLAPDLGLLVELDLLLLLAIVRMSSFIRSEFQRLGHVHSRTLQSIKTKYMDILISLGDLRADRLLLAGVASGGFWATKTGWLDS